MTIPLHSVNVAVLDDYQGVALNIVDWSTVNELAKITVFRDHLADQDAVARRLAPFDVVCIMRERTPLPASLLGRLPKLKLIVSTGPGNASIDLAAAAERGITVANTGYTSSPTIELTWALILARSLSEYLLVLSHGRWISLGFGLFGLGPTLCAHYPPQSTPTLQERRQIFKTLWVKHISCHSADTFSRPRNRNLRIPRADLIMPNTGSTMCLRAA